MNTLCFISEASENMMGPSYPVNTSILEFLDLFLLFFILFLESCLFFSFFKIFLQYLTHRFLT